jgi:hypothetical protein
MPLQAIVLICVGCALGLAGLVVLVVTMVGLLRAAQKAGISNMADVREVTARVQRLEPRFRELEKRQAILAESLQRLATEAGSLNYLKKELDRATGRVSNLKS